MQPILDALERLLLVAVAIPVVFIVADAGLVLTEARADNEIVAFVADTAEALTPVFAVDVLVEQAHWQTALIAVIAWGAAALFFVAVFRGLRAVLAALQRRQAAANRAA